MGNPRPKRAEFRHAQRVGTVEEVGKRPSDSRLLSLFPLRRSLSLGCTVRRGLKKGFAFREGEGGATNARNSGIPRTAGGGGKRETVSRRPGRDEGENAYIVGVLSFGAADGTRGEMRAGKVTKGKLGCSGRTDRAREQPVQRVPTLSRDILSISRRAMFDFVTSNLADNTRGIGDFCDPVDREKCAYVTCKVVSVRWSGCSRSR